MLIRDAIKERLSGKIKSWYEHNPRRIYINLEPSDIKETARILFRELGLRFSIASGQDTPQGIEIIYHFSVDRSPEIVSLRVLLEDRKNPAIDSLVSLFPAAEWIEREMWELLGIKFSGHPNMKHLLLADEWPEGKYPLRKNEP